MAATIITTEDLMDFKAELLQEISLLLSAGSTSAKQWLRSSELRKLLKISPGTLQNLRVNGTIPYTKIGGVIYYAYDDVLKMLEENKLQHKS